MMLICAKAFDTIDHAILFNNLVKYGGFRGKVLDLIKSYFSDRTQRVHIN